MQGQVSAAVVLVVTSLVLGLLLSCLFVVQGECWSCAGPAVVMFVCCAG